MAKHIIIRTPDGEVEHFHGNDLTATVDPDGYLYIYEAEASKSKSIGIFNQWQYIRRIEPPKTP